MTERALTAVASGELAPVREFEIDVNRVVAQTIAVQEVMVKLMKNDEHFGVIPGTQKPSLWQPGADKLCVLFKLRPEFEIVDKIESDALISVTVRCRLFQVGGTSIMGEGIGSANSREKKFASQISAKTCPKCSAATIRKGRQEWGGGWYCDAKKGSGCGAKFKDGDKSIESQAGTVQIDALYELHNTILKRAAKRAKVSGVLTFTAATDVFSQDLEDLEDLDYTPPPTTRGKRQDKAVDVESAPVDDVPPPTDGDAILNEALTASMTVEVIDAKTGEVTRKPKVTAAQLKKIHVLKKEQRWSDERWKAELVKAYGFDSSAKMSKDQAAHWIEKLERKGQQVGGENDEMAKLAADLEDDDIAAHCSQEQMNEIGVEMDRLGWPTAARSNWLLTAYRKPTRSELTQSEAANALMCLMKLPDGTKWEVR